MTCENQTADWFPVLRGLPSLTHAIACIPTCWLSIKRQDSRSLIENEAEGCSQEGWLLDPQGLFSKAVFGFVLLLEILHWYPFRVDPEDCKFPSKRQNALLMWSADSLTKQNSLSGAFCFPKPCAPTRVSAKTKREGLYLRLSVLICYTRIRADPLVQTHTTQPIFHVYFRASLMSN